MNEKESKVKKKKKQRNDIKSKEKKKKKNKGKKNLQALFLLISSRRDVFLLSANQSFHSKSPSNLSKPIDI